jgi:hypothetical protein
VKTWKVILAALVIFVAGAVTGGIVTWQTKLPWRLKSSKPSAGTPTQSQSPWLLQRPDFAQRMKRELELGDQEVAKVEGILRKSRQRTELLWEVLREPLQEELIQVKSEIFAVLTPEQGKKFEELLKPKPFGKRPPDHQRWSKEPRPPKPGEHPDKPGEKPPPPPPPPVQR